jgi:hypothetical protein
MKGLTITVDEAGRYTVAPFDGGLAELQAAVGGLIDCAPSDPSVTLWVNDDGLGRLPWNRLAMDVWLRWDIYGCMAAGDGLAGTCVVTGGADPDGETLDIPAAAAAWVLRVAYDAGAVVRPGRP